LCLGANCAAAHGNIGNPSFARYLAAYERHREVYRYAFVLSAVLVYPEISYAPLNGAESVPTELTSKRVNIKEAHQAFGDRFSTNAYDVFRGTLWANWWLQETPPFL